MPEDLEGWKPTRWWRVTYEIYNEEHLWAETSDEQEARDALAQARELGHVARLMRLHRWEQEKWVNVPEEPASTPESEKPESVPYTIVDNPDAPPWGDDRTCPECGEKDLPLLDSDPPMLTFISHCGHSWVRGPIKR